MLTPQQTKNRIAKIAEQKRERENAKKQAVAQAAAIISLLTLAIAIAQSRKPSFLRRLTSAVNRYI